MARPAVSFILTVYNKERYLAEVLGAVAAQEGNFERETIIVDDGSTDGSRALIERLGPRLPGFRLIVQPNQGPAVTTNRGLAAARMPLVKLLDGDDLLAPYATRHLIEAMERLDADVVIGAGFEYRLGEPARWPGISPTLPLPLADPLAALIRSIWFTPSNMLIRRAALAASGGCDERVFVQDYALALRLAAAGRVGTCDTVIVATPEMRGGPDRLSANKAQILHDLNLALLLFIDERPGLPAHYRRLACRRLAGRAWKWAHREAGRPFLSGELALCLAAWCGSRRAAWASLETFATSGKVRRRPIAGLRRGRAP